MYLRPARRRDADRFLAAVEDSRLLHRGWVEPPATPSGYAAYIARFGRPGVDPATLSHYGFLVLRVTDEALLGVFNFSEIVRSSYQSAYLGYYAFAPYQGEGYMAEAMVLALDAAFRNMKLHRVEANIQPSNQPSLDLVRRTGFTREGIARRYLRIGGRWRDHERWAMLAEDWRARIRRAL